MKRNFFSFYEASNNMRVCCLNRTTPKSVNRQGDHKISKRIILAAISVSNSICELSL